jgi:hypothetical protein
LAFASNNVMSDSPQTTPLSTPLPVSAPASPASDPELSHLANLHRMSRTAGLGSSEYAAVNVAAVVAVIIGGASALALVSPIFLFLPVIGTIIALVAIKQIRNSSGTQTGLSLAILALVLSFGLAAFTGVKALMAASQERADVRELDDTTVRFGKLLTDKQYAEAYKLTDERFQEQVPMTRFESVFDEIASMPAIGPLKSVSTPKLFDITTDPETGRRNATSRATFETEKRTGPSALVTDISYRHNGAAWRIYAIPQLFPAKAPTAGGAGAAPAGPAGPPTPGG